MEPRFALAIAVASIFEAREKDITESATCKGTPKNYIVKIASFSDLKGFNCFSDKAFSMCFKASFLLPLCL